MTCHEMDKMCKKSEAEDLNKSIETERTKCGSPVFKCVTQIKPVRDLDSSDYDIPSYQVNQSIKSRTSSKCCNETSESVLPFSPVFSPIPVVPVPQFHPPSIHSLATVSKNLEKSAHIKVNSFSECNKKDDFKSGGIFESLGTLDKDISWVSSMASPPPKQIPGSELNTVEKATFLPEENFQSIQPRALFSPTFDDDFGCQPIEFTSESDDDDAYKSNIRLSDVCATLKQLEVKSLDQASNNSVEKRKDHVISPVIKTKKKKSENVIKKKKGGLVLSPDEKYEFSVGENLSGECNKVKTNEGSNFIEDDSFQSISFSGIDELCKTLVTEQSDSFEISKISDKTLVSNINSKPSEILKKFYTTKVATLIHSVSSMDNIHSSIKALEEGSKYIPSGGKIDQSYAEKGIVRFDVFSKESKSDATKRLHSEVDEEKDESIEKKFKKVDDRHSGWENVKQYLSESQLNVSDGEIFKTVENLEKSLASQEKKEMEKLSGEEMSQEKEGSTISDQNIVKEEYLLEMKFPAFATASGLKISVSEKSLNKAREILKDCDENLKDVPSGAMGSFVGFSTCSGKEIKISEEALEKGKAFMLKCETSDIVSKPNEVDDKFWEGKINNFKPGLKKHVECDENLPKDGESVGDVIPQGSEQKECLMKGFTTGTGKLIKVSAQSLAKAKAFMLECDEKNTSQNQISFESVKPEIFKGFSTGSGKSIQISEKALEKAKVFMKKCENEFNENFELSCTTVQPETHNKSQTEETPMVGFSTALGKKVNVSSEALAKAKSLWTRSDETLEIPPTEKENSLLKQNKPDNVEKIKEKELLEVDESDWDEIIPDWLHVYTTSPTSENLRLSPDENTKTYKPYIKSPVLGPNDRFYGKTKKRKLQFGGESKSQIVTPEEGRCNVKRSLNLDFSIPFKKIKVVEDVNVKEKRQHAREEQEKTVKEKQKVKPLEGLHLRKKRSQRQISWMEAVERSSPETHSDELLISLGVCEDVLHVNIKNSMDFIFNGEHHFGSAVLNNTNGIPAGDNCLLIPDNDNNIGVEELKRAFLASPGVQPNLLPTGWVENHYKWIIWKLAHYERSFPLHFGGICLTPNQVLLQLKYRYDREIDRNERSALKKILERDDSSIKRLVLCVAGIKKVATGYELELTDGWYSCPAHVDLAMSRIIEEGKVFVGVKLMTQGAILVNCEQGVSPLEMSEGVYLKIATNSTRRVRWDTKLGFQKNPENFPISIGSILAQGGSITRIDVIIVRIYPMLYMEKTDGHHVTRNRRTEEKADAEYRKIQEQQMEIIYNEIESEIRRFGNSLEDGDDFCRLMEDPVVLQNLMLTDHKKLIEKLQSNDRFSREFIQKIEKMLEKEKVKKRVVNEFLRVKIVDFRKPDYNNPAILSVWNPNEDLNSVLAEGKVVSVMNLTINNSSRLYKPLQINTTRQTQFRPINKNVKYPKRNLTQLNNVSSKVCPAFEEVDLVGIIALIQDVSHGSRLSQVVYLTDLDMNFVGIVFWGSCKDFGWENVLRVKSIVACSNLQWKKNYKNQDVPSVYVNENSVFTENPKQSYLKEEIERLKQNSPQDIASFISKCEEELTGKLEDSKWRNHSLNDSSSREKPQTPKVDGFESKPTASSTPIKPFAFRSCSKEAEPSPIEKKIEKLQRYGEPSPLIPLLIRNNIKRKFKKRTKPSNNQSAS